MTGRKGRFTKLLKRSVLFVLVAAFLFLAVYQDYLHNHSLIVGERDDCPVFQFKRAVNFLPAAMCSLFIVLLVAFFKSCLADHKLNTRILFTNPGSRAPPFLA